MAAKHPRATRADFPVFQTVPTRWSDNDIYGHANNTVYYAWIDTAVNRVLIDRGTLDPGRSDTFGIVVENGCRFHAEISYPDLVTIGLRIARLGTSSIRYELGIFRNDDSTAAAEAHFVHVYVARETMRPVPIPANVRLALADLIRED
ncbi:MAG: acyl-CoA thioesterase [Rhodospirillales bacterium]|jgi:acyl-CoA thioester hydrolase|nr:acyl-CoA thioesterase [Rhodospirillales bacterium]